MKKIRTKDAFAMACRLFYENSGELFRIKGANELETLGLVEERATLIAKKCWWAAVYALDEMDKQYKSMNGRLKK